MSCLYQTSCRLSITEKVSESYGVISYGSGWSKDVNQCLEFDRQRHRGRKRVECCFTSTETEALLGTGAQDDHFHFHTPPELRMRVGEIDFEQPAFNFLGHIWPKKKNTFDEDHHYYYHHHHHHHQQQQQQQQSLPLSTLAISSTVISLPPVLISRLEVYHNWKARRDTAHNWKAWQAR